MKYLFIQLLCSLFIASIGEVVISKRCKHSKLYLTVLYSLMLLLEILFLFVFYSNVCMAVSSFGVVCNVCYWYVACIRVYRWFSYK